MGRSALLVLICAGAAGAQNPYSVVPPVALMQCRQPEYTEEARIAHLAGIVTMSLTVDDDGMPTDIHVVSPVGLGLDESATACMRQSRYSPAQKDGKPVPLKINPNQSGISLLRPGPCSSASSVTRPPDGG